MNNTLTPITKVSFWTPLSERNRQPELMDDPLLDHQLHQQALQGLSRINWLTRTHRLLWKPIEAYCQKNNLKKISVLDLGCGSGDLLIWLNAQARSKGIDLKMTGCDMSPIALKVARQRAEQKNLESTFIQMDVLDDELPPGHDVILNSLFLHHLSENDVVNLLQCMQAATKQLVIVQDLLRTRWGYMMCWVGTRLITRSSIVHIDGPLSVAGAFTLTEIQQLALQAGLDGCRILHRWPERFVLTWQQP